jgi:hypothetical protein
MSNNIQIEKARELAAYLRRDNIYSLLSYSGKCATALGIAYMGVSVLKDAHAERYLNAIVDTGVCLGLCALYSCFSSQIREVSQRIARNKLILENILSRESSSDNSSRDVK